MKYDVYLVTEDLRHENWSNMIKYVGSTHHKWNMVKQIIMMVNHVSKAIVEHPQFYHEWVV